MTKKNQQYYGALAALIVIVAIVWFAKSKRSASDTQTSDNQPKQTEQTLQEKTTTPTSITGNNSESVWTGKLMASDNSKKGNLMLVTKDHTIYIKTNRDYSSLEGNNVRVSYQGTADSFTLGDITVSEPQ